MEKIKQNIASFIYERAVSDNVHSSLSQMLFKIRNMVLHYCDPIVDIELDGIKLCLPLSHNFPLYYSLYPKYDRMLPKICASLKYSENSMQLIDIGANIGDTISLVDKKTMGQALCIEGDERYIPFLYENASRLKNLKTIIVPSFCTDKEIDNAKYKIASTGKGTSSLVEEVGVKTSLSFMTLDRIISENSSFENANILKIDTDGFEVKTLIGGRQYILSAKPMIYFEFVPRKISYQQIQQDISPYDLEDSDEEAVFPLIKSMGYDTALFFDNFGNYRGQIDTGNILLIKDMIGKIDMKTICYYDVLVCHNAKLTHKNILDHIHVTRGIMPSF